MAKKNTRNLSTIQEAKEQFRLLGNDLKERLAGKWTDLPEPKRWQIRAGAVGAAVLALALVVTASLGIYTLGWQNGFTRAVSRFVPLPAAFVGGAPISYNSYANEAYRLEKISGTPPGAGLNRQAMGTLVNQAVVKKWAEKNKIKVSNQEISTEIDRLKAAYGSQKAVGQAFRREYGAAAADLAGFIRQGILTRKVEKAVSGDAKLKAAANERAREILELSKKEDFAKLAKQHSSHYSAVTGDGIVDSNQLPLAVQQAAARAEIGQVVNSVVEADGNYYVLKRENSNDQTIKVRLIMVETLNFNRWLAEEVSKARVTRLLPQTK